MAEVKSKSPKAARAALIKRAEEDKLFRDSIAFGDMEYATRLPLEKDYIARLGLDRYEREGGPLGLSEYIHHIIKNEETGEISGDVPGRSIYRTSVRGQYHPTDNPVNPGNMYINTTDMIGELGSPEGEHAEDRALLERHLSGNAVVAHELGHAGLESLGKVRPELITEGRELGIGEHGVIRPMDASRRYAGVDFPERLLSEEERRRVKRLNVEDPSLDPSNIRMAKAIASGWTPENKGMWELIASLFRKATEKEKAGGELSRRERAVVGYITRLQEAARKETRNRRGVR